MSATLKASNLYYFLIFSWQKYFLDSESQILLSHKLVQTSKACSPCKLWVSVALLSEVEQKTLRTEENTLSSTHAWQTICRTTRGISARFSDVPVTCSLLFPFYGGLLTAERTVLGGGILWEAKALEQSHTEAVRSLWDTWREPSASGVMF